jgi:peptidoglycan/LPS O-acetylase OafA/YrhL
MTTTNNPQEVLSGIVEKVERRSLLDGGRIPSLDGLRAISIAMVLGEHAINAVYRNNHSGHDYDGPWKALCNGGLGVSTFFTISGFLITLLLLRELKKTGKISLTDFYIRRAFRIWPAFYFYIACVVVLGKLGYLAIGHRALLAACFFVFNYVPNVGTWWVAHSWSLSVEEQFYFFWPALLVLLGRRRSAIAAVSLLAIVPAIRVAETLLLPSNNRFIVNMWQMGHTRLDSLMFGCAIALAYGDQRFQRALNSAFRFGAPWIALLYLFIIAPYSTRFHSTLYQSAIGYTLDSLFVSVLILWVVQHASSLPGRVLNSKPLIHIGLISYSLYLWQQMFLVGANKTWTGRFPLNILCAFLMAELSFYAIERPFLRLRKKAV